MYRRNPYNAVRFFQNHFNTVLNYDVISFLLMRVKDASINIALSSQKNMSCYCRLNGNAADFYNECMVYLRLYVDMYIYSAHILSLSSFSLYGCLAEPYPTLCSLSFRGLSRIINIMPISHSNHPSIFLYRIIFSAIRSMHRIHSSHFSACTTLIFFNQEMLVSASVF